LAFFHLRDKAREFFSEHCRYAQSFLGNKVGLDLYISVFLSLALIYLIEGSVVVMLLWLLPILAFANLAILPYILLNYGAIIGHFLP
jgi:hypothetical protein